jgi:hypothetical protein
VTLWDVVSTTAYVGVTVSGDGSANNNNAGTPTNLVNGVALSPDTRAGLYTALGSSVAIFEVQGANLAVLGNEWTGFKLGNYTTFEFAGRMMEVLILPALSAGNRTALRSYLGTKHGVAV